MIAPSAGVRQCFPRPVLRRADSSSCLRLRSWFVAVRLCSRASAEDYGKRTMASRRGIPGAVGPRKFRNPRYSRGQAATGDLSSVSTNRRALFKPSHFWEELNDPFPLRSQSGRSTWPRLFSPDLEGKLVDYLPNPPVIPKPLKLDDMLCISELGGIDSRMG